MVFFALYEQKRPWSFFLDFAEIATLESRALIVGGRKGGRAGQGRLVLKHQPPVRP